LRIESGIAYDTTFNEVEAQIDESKNYLENMDFDGDKISDYLSFNYTGGAHCCYKIVLKLSSIKDTIKYPFEMDGGYGLGIIESRDYTYWDTELCN
jgi:hypothetical protein